MFLLDNKVNRPVEFSALWGSVRTVKNSRERLEAMAVADRTDILTGKEKVLNNSFINYVGADKWIM